MAGHLTPMCDTFAFGVVLLELLFGKPAVDRGRPSGETYLIDRTRPLLIQSKKVLTRAFDPRMEGQYSSKAATKVANLAYMCIKDNPRRRPPMTNVVEILELVQKLELRQEKGNQVKGDSENKASK